MKTRDKQLIDLLGDQIHPSFKEQLENPRLESPRDGAEKIASPRSFQDKGPILPSFLKNSGQLIRMFSMQQLEVLKERSNDKMIVLLFYGKRFPVSNQIKIRLAELASKMKHLIMTWSDLDIDKEVV